MVLEVVVDNLGEKGRDDVEEGAACREGGRERRGSGVG